MNQTQNLNLPQWEAEDRIMMDDFNDAMASIDAALAAEAAAREAGDASNCFVKLLDLTLNTERQKWDIDMSGIDLTQYQKLLICPRLKGNTNQWVYVHINGNSTECGQIPMYNDINRQNFGVVELTMLMELPYLYIIQTGVNTTNTSAKVADTGYRCPALSSGATHLNTLNFWFGSSGDHILVGSQVTIYGLKR